MYKILIKTLLIAALSIITTLAMEKQSNASDLLKILKIKSPPALFYEALPIIKKYNKEELAALEIEPDLKHYALKLKSDINKKLLSSIVTDKGINILLNFGGNIDAQDSNGITPLFRAAANGKYEMIKTLLDKGANPNIRSFDGMSALIRTAVNLSLRLKDESQLLKIAKLLIQSKADVNAVDENNNSALLFAVIALSDKMVKLLLENVANPNIEDTNYHLTPLMYAVSEKTTDENRQAQLNIVTMLIKHGAALFKTNSYGQTAYDIAKDRDNTEIAHILKLAMQKRG